MTTPIQLFRCPHDGASVLFTDDDRLRCDGCGCVWRIIPERVLTGPTCDGVVRVTEEEAEPEPAAPEGTRQGYQAKHASVPGIGRIDWAQVVQLRDIQRLSWKEIAALTGRTPGTLTNGYQRIQRAIDHAVN